MKVTIIGCGNIGLVYARSFLKYNIVSKNNLLLVARNETRREELNLLDIGEVLLIDNNKISKK
jgi:pyrroline-5-carboxylate reductase